MMIGYCMTSEMVLHNFPCGFDAEPEQNPNRIQTIFYAFSGGLK